MTAFSIDVWASIMLTILLTAIALYTIFSLPRWIRLTVSELLHSDCSEHGEGPR